jgi:hypothetical protein
MKYRIIKREFLTYIDYTIQRKSLIGWHDTHETFNTIAEARSYINRRSVPKKSVVEVIDV